MIYSFCRQWFLSFITAVLVRSMQHEIWTSAGPMRWGPLSQLMEAGKTGSLFRTLEPVPEKERELKLDRPLYSHQKGCWSIL